jgi:hypothetical protein
MAADVRIAERLESFPADHPEGEGIGYPDMSLGGEHAQWFRRRFRQREPAPPRARGQPSVRRAA